MHFHVEKRELSLLYWLPIWLQTKDATMWSQTAKKESLFGIISQSQGKKKAKTSKNDSNTVSKQIPNPDILPYLFCNSSCSWLCMLYAHGGQGSSTQNAPCCQSLQPQQPRVTVKMCHQRWHTTRTQPVISGFVVCLDRVTAPGWHHVAGSDFLSGVKTAQESARVLI